MKQFLSSLTVLSFLLVSGFGQEVANDEEFARKAQRYHRLIERRPRRGTALDMLYRYYLDAGKVDSLVQHYEQKVKEDGEQHTTRMTLGLLYERQARLEESLVHIQKASELANDDFYPSYAAGLMLTRLHRYAEAIDAFTKAEQKQPDRTTLVDIYKRLGRLHLMQGDKVKALAAWAKLTDQFPEDRLAVGKLAELLAEEEQFDEAIKRYGELIEKSKDDPYQQLTSKVEIGQIQVRQGKLETALETFEKCLAQVKPDSWQAKDIRRRIEEIFLKSDDLSGLAEYYESVIKKRPDDLAAMTQLATTLARLGRSDDALHKYEEILKLAPSRQEIRIKLIDVLTDREKFEEAIKQTETLVSLDKGNVDYLRRLGHLHLQAGADNREAAEKKALDVWAQVASARPNDALSAVRVAEFCRNAAGIGSRLSSSTDNVEQFKKQVESVLGKAALQYYQDAVKLAPNVPQYHEYLGEFYYSIGRNDEAIEAWRQLAAAPNDSLENLKRLAEVFAGASQLDEAIKVINDAAEKNTNRYDVHKLAAELYSKKPDYDKALEHIDLMEKLADTPFFEEQAMIARVETYASSNRLAEESDKLVQSLESGKSSARDYWLAGMMAIAERRSHLAVNYLEEAIKIRPKDARLLRFKADAHRLGGDLAGAAEQFSKLAKLEPKNRTAHLREVVSLEMELGRFDAAKETAESIIRFSPSSSEAVQLLADVHFRAGKEEEGLKAFRRAVRVDPRNIEIRMALAQRLLQRQETTEAIDHFWRAFELSDDLDGKLMVVGELAEQHIITGRINELVERLKRLNSDQEDSLGGALLLVEVHARAEDFVSARRELNTLLARRPNDVQVLNQLVALSERLGDLDAAAEHQEKISQISPSANALQKLANFYNQIGKEEQARDLWFKVIEKAKDEKAILAAIERAARNDEHTTVIALCEREMEKRPDDWRVAYHLLQSYWKSKQAEKAETLARDLLTLLPNSTYKLDQKKNSNWSRSYTSYYPPIYARINAPSTARALLAPVGMSYRASWQPKELQDVKLFATVLLHESARVSGTIEQFEKDLAERSKKDLNALRQLYWVKMSMINSGHHHDHHDQDELQKLLERWIETSPEDAEPRLALVMYPMYRPQNQNASPEEAIADLEKQFAWFEKNRPNLAQSMAAMYAQRMMQMGQRDKAIEYTKKTIAKATNLRDLVMIASSATQSQDLDVLSQLIAKIEKLGGSRNTSIGWMSTSQLMQSYLQASLISKDSKRILDSFDKYMALTHPRTISNSRSAASGRGGSYPQQLVYSSGARIRSRRGAQASFPTPSAWLDASRFQMLNTTYRSLAKIGEMDSLMDLAKKRAEQEEGIPKQCWQMCVIVLHWLGDESDSAIKKLESMVAESPGSVHAKMQLAHAYSQQADPKNALKTIANTHLPFGRMAKQLEQLRLQLAQSAGDDDAGKQAALRLFGMRLNSNEQTQLAKAMRSFGFATRSEELMKRAVRTASNKPSELYRLLQQNSGNKKRATEIARMILRQVRSSTNRNNSNATYRRRALTTLKSVGELQPMIEKAEQQLAAAPKSIRIMESLLEYYTADGNTTKASEITDKILELRPNDTHLHFSIAQRLFKQNKFEQGIKRLDPVWKNQPMLVLQQGHQYAQYYARAKKIDLLAEQIKNVKFSPQSNNHYQLSNFVSNLQHSGSSIDVDDMSKVYQAAIEALPEAMRTDMIRNFAQMLTQKNRKPQAYALYHETIFPEKKEGRILPPSTSQHYRNGNLVTVPIEFLDLAKQIKKFDELKQDIVETSKSKKAFASLGDLLLAMISRREGDEKPLQAIGERFLENKTFAAEIGSHTYSLREELRNCQSEPVLRVAIKVWEKSTANNNSYYQYGNNAKSIAGIYIKLKERDTAREVMRKALVPPRNNFNLHTYGGEQEVRRLIPIARAMRDLGFHIDAVGTYHKAITQSLDLPPTSYVRRSELPRNMNYMRQSVASVISTGQEDAIAELISELSKEDFDISGFFAIVDPPSQEETRYSSSARRRAAAYTPAKVANPDKQLLTAIMHAANTEKLEKIKELADQRLEDLSDGKKTKEQRAQLEALKVLAQLHKNPEESVESIESWLDRISKKKVMAQQSETWLLALAATRNERTRALGMQLASQVAKSAALQSNTGRQKAAVALLANTGSKASDKVISDLLSARKGDPETLYQVAQVHFQQNQYEKGIEALDRVWKLAPDLIFPEFQEIVQYYIKSDNADALAKAVRSVNDPQMQQQYGYEYSRVFEKLPKTRKAAKNVEALYFAGLDFVSQSYVSNVHYRYSRYLSNLPKDKKTLELYISAVYPSKTHAGGSLDRFLSPFLSLVTRTKQTEQIMKKTQDAIKEHPSWKSSGEFLLAVLERRQGNEKPIVEIAKRFESDSVFASEFASLSSLLRNELYNCKQKDAMELALKLYREVAAAETGQSYSYTTNVAQLLKKLDRTEEAKQVLLERLNRPFSINYNTDDDSRMQMEAQLYNQIASSLNQHGFSLEAIGAYGKTARLNTTTLRSDSYTQTLKKRARDQSAQLIKKLLASGGEKTLTQLDKALQSEERQPELGPYFTVFDGGTNSKEPPQVLLPGVIKAAKEKDQLLTLRDAVLDAKKRWPKNRQLAAMEVMIGMAIDPSSQKDNLTELAEQLEKSPSANDEMWLIAKAALDSETHADVGQRLGELVFHASRQAGFTSRENSMLFALIDSYKKNGKPDQADALMKHLMGKDKDPKAMIQLALVLVHQDQHDAAVAALDPLLRNHLDQVIVHFNDLAQIYMKASKVKQLAQAIRGIEDQDLKGRHSYDLLNATYALGNKSKQLDSAIELTIAAAHFATENAHDYAWERVQRLVAKKKDKPKTWEILRDATIPPVGPTKRLSNLGKNLIDMTIELNKEDELRTAMEHAVEKHPEWKPCRDLLLAMTNLRKDKDEKAFVELAAKFNSDKEFARPLQASASLLRSEIAKCKNQDVLKLAVKLWTEEVDRLRNQNYSSSTNYQNYANLGEMLARAGDRKKALTVLREAVTAPGPNYSDNYAEYYAFQRRQFLIPKFQSADFHLDALFLLDENLKLEGSNVASQYSNIKNAMKTQKQLARKSVKYLLTKDLDATLAEFEKALKRSPAELSAFFHVVSPVWNTGETKEIPEHARLAIPEQTQLLTALLLHAKSRERLVEIAKEAQSASNRLSKDQNLALLAALTTSISNPDDEKAIDQMIVHAKKEAIDRNARLLALSQLSNSASQKATDAIVAAVKTDAASKRIATQALRRQGTAYAAEKLGNWYATTDPMLRLNAERALVNMNAQGIRDILDIERVAFEDFEGKPSLDWKIENQVDERISYEKRPGTLTIKGANSEFAKSQDTHKNVFLIENPVRGQDFQITMKVVGFKPDDPYQQATLLVWNDADNYVKLAYQCARQGDPPSLVAIGEVDAKWPKYTTVDLAETAEDVWLRISRYHNSYVYSTSLDGKSFEAHGSVEWKGGEPKYVGLSALTPQAQEMDISIDSFEIARPVGSAVVAPRDIVIAEASRKIDNAPKRAANWFAKGELFGRQQRWEEATEDFEKGLALNAANHNRWCQLAALYAIQRDQVNYERVCKTMLEKFKATDKPYIAERMAKACLLSSKPFDLATATRLADRAVSMAGDSSTGHWVMQAKGISDIRNGKFDQARDNLKDSLKKADKYNRACRSMNYLFLAIANHHINRPEIAEKALNKAVLVAKPMLDGGEAQQWHYWCMIQTVTEEVQTLLGVTNSNQTSEK